MTPRASWFGIFRKRAGWPLIWVTLACLAVTLLSALAFNDDARFARHGVMVPAQLVEKSISYGERERDDGRIETVAVPRFFYQYQWELRRYRHSVWPDQATYDAAEIGDMTELRILPDAPERVQDAPNARRIEAVFLQVIAGLLGGVALVLLWRAGLAANSAIRARERGEMLLATVEGYRKYNLDKSRLLMRTRQRQYGQSLPHFRRDLERGHPVGSDIWVYRDGKTLWWEGDTGPRVDRASPVPQVDDARATDEPAVRADLRE